MTTPQEFAERLVQRLQCAANARKLPPDYAAGVRSDVEIIRLETEARDNERKVDPEVLKQFPGRLFEYLDKNKHLRPEASLSVSENLMRWPAMFGKFTSPPWYPIVKDIDPPRWAVRVTETSIAAMRACGCP